MHPIQTMRRRPAETDADTWFWEEPWWLLDPDVFEDRCRTYVESVRWPDGVVCPRCASEETGRLTVRKRFSCRPCKYQFSVTAGTVMHNSHAPLWKWLLAVRLLVGSDGGLPANQLIRQLGGSYKTAWFIEHRVRSALVAAHSVPAPSNGRGGDADPACGRVYDRTVVGCYHQHGLGYLDAYRAEHEWRRRQADNPARFLETLRALLDAEPLAYTTLVAGAARRAQRPQATRTGSLQSSSSMSGVAQAELNA